MLPTKGLTMKKMLFVLLTIAGVVSARPELTPCEITPENCVECVRQGTPRDMVMTRLRQLVEEGVITPEVEESCIAALNAITE